MLALTYQQHLNSLYTLREQLSILANAGGDIGIASSTALGSLDKYTNWAKGHPNSINNIFREDGSEARAEAANKAG